MSAIPPPYALFILSDTADVDYLNDVLRRTSESNFGDLFLSLVDIPNQESPYDCAPDRETTREHGEERELPAEGTRPPVSNTFTSPFLNQSLDDCVKYLRATPEKKAWNTEYFCVVGKDDKAEDTVTVVRSFNHGAVHAFPCKTEETGSFMFTGYSENFEEKMQTYQKLAKANGDKDRSVGVPYEFMDRE
ncbi:hypothetical protein VFPPC_06366 [Pochonia chlamydosporia 170]|uniref:Uncharacterized protein n=1 Tax=Pochonia chlamydosporia 170 TaxID=1380566 RepID=A0A179FJK7_METCM|nr:hypothetical protein VFPPC_06366 [Pochonia chlamydosporia 170]OAQ65219.1 hypothetical protein VFPPC_06366 [Pochonia chlamydosporia 170]